MATSSAFSRHHFKSPLRCLCRALFDSRNRWKRIAQLHRDAIRQLRQQLRVAHQRERQLIEQCDLFRRQAESLQSQVDQADTIAQWNNLDGHQFSAEMISLCCRLSPLVGLRAVPKVLHCIGQALGLSWRIPSRDAVRNWNCRNGVAILQENTPADDWVWMIDHSVQLGKMFVLVVLGIAQSQLPSGRPLRRDDMVPLAVLPTDSRSKEEVGRQLTEVAKRYGNPLAIVSDGARELHEGAECLKTAGFQGVHLDDIKHKISNLLKKKLGSDERFQAFSAKLAQTTASIQQTELDHLLPPRKKEKCRFMSFDRLIDWATMVQHQLSRDHDADIGLTERLAEKLGWLGEFDVDLRCWRECRRLVGQVLRYANEQGVFVGSTEALRQTLEASPADSELARQLREQMISFYQSNENLLSTLKRADLRLPCSTEVMESAFGSFKAMGGHHGRGTFTSLLATFAILFDSCRPTKIRERFARVSNQDLKRWQRDSGLTNSTQSRRTLAYAQATTAG